MRKIFYIIFIFLIQDITNKVSKDHKASKNAFEFRSLLKLLKKGKADSKTVQKVTNLYFLKKNKKKSRKLIMGILSSILPSLKKYLPAIVPIALGGAVLKIRKDENKKLEDLKKKSFLKKKELSMIIGELNSRKTEIHHELMEVGINLDDLDKMLTETVPELSTSLSERSLI